MLSVIGVGYPRTGTMSLKLALEQLGFGPCYHMIEVFNRIDDVPLWRQALSGTVDWNQIFNGFQSACDAPACHFWRELLEEYPEAKVILTLRDSDTWYESFRETVYEVSTHPERAPDKAHRQVQGIAREVILETMLDNSFEDRERAIQIYEDYNKTIQEEVDPQRLLVFRVREGWQPLCDFLGVDTPSGPFPHINTRDEFRERLIVEQSHH